MAGGPSNMHTGDDEDVDLYGMSRRFPTRLGFPRRN